MDNPNPEIKPVAPRAARAPVSREASQTMRALIFDAIRDIRDPEHPHTLEELSVVDEDSVVVVEPGRVPACSRCPKSSCQCGLSPQPLSFGLVEVSFTPTVPHCSLASLIGLCIRTKLTQGHVVPPNYKLDVVVVEGTHATDKEISKQLNDKERVAAAMENPRLLQMVEECLFY